MDASRVAGGTAVSSGWCWGRSGESLTQGGWNNPPDSPGRYDVVIPRKGLEMEKERGPLALGGGRRSRFRAHSTQTLTAAHRRNCVGPDPLVGASASQTLNHRDERDRWPPNVNVHVFASAQVDQSNNGQ